MLSYGLWYQLNNDRYVTALIVKGLQFCNRESVFLCIFFLFVYILFLQTDPQIKKLLAHTVQYLGVPASPTSSFTRFLNVKNGVETKSVHDTLVSWGKREADKPAEPAIFCSSMLHLQHVYLYLCQNLAAKVSALFRTLG
jgi:hypothetical protein